MFLIYLVASKKLVATVTRKCHFDMLRGLSTQIPSCYCRRIGKRFVKITNNIRLCPENFFSTGFRDDIREC